MPRPQLYINVSQTMAIGTIAVFVLSYIFRKDFRQDVNDVLIGRAPMPAGYYETRTAR